MTDKDALGGGIYLAGRPKPSDIMNSVTSEARFGDGTDLLGKGSGGGGGGGGAVLPREHHRVKGRSATPTAQSAAAAAAEARMATMQKKQAPKPAPAALPSSNSTTPPQPPKATPPPTTTATPVVGNEGAVMELMSMGFPEKAARVALSQTGGDVGRAVGVLLN
jgi:hypothetical protein